MQFNQIRYFLAVAKSLSFTSASSELYISQPALSKQISLLEEELGVKLFERSSRKVALTEAGKYFERELLRLQGDLEETVRRVKEFGKIKTDIIRLALFDGAYIEDCLVPTNHMLETMFPGVPVNYFRGAFKENYQALEKDAVDILLTLDTGMISEKIYQTYPICSRKAALVYGANSSLGKKDHLVLQDFNHENFLILEESQNPMLYHRGLKSLEQIGLRPKSIITQNNFISLMTNVLMGQGFALLTQDVANGNPAIKVWPIENEEHDMTIIAVWKKKHRLADLFMEGFEKTV